MRKSRARPAIWRELFTALDQQFPDLKPHLRDEAGEIRRFLNVYVNEEDIRFLGGNKYAFQDGDEVLLVPSIAGGATLAVILSAGLRFALRNAMRSRRTPTVAMTIASEIVSAVR